MASSSSSSSPSSASSSGQRWEHDVFLSFRGEDMRKRFTGHLYNALKRNGLNAFIDNKSLERGKAIAPELLRAIRCSRSSVVILSTSYASSTWCLDELVEILDSRRSNQHYYVFPVFFDVEPCVVRKQTESFKEAFDRHEPIVAADKVQRWRAALTDVANLSGWHLGDRDESEFIEEIVREISGKISLALPSAFEDGLIGINEHLENLSLCMDIQSNDIRVIGLWGMGGVGKTTLARALYKRISHNFEGRSFLADVREESVNGHLVSLQKQLLSETLTSGHSNFWNVYDGVDIIRNRLCQKRVLLVADDVDNLDQLKFLGKPEWFGPGSRIIITTRNKHLLEAYGMNTVYEVKVLSGDESLQLFSLKAFKSDQPPKVFQRFSRQVIRYAGGLPLALEVLGSFFCGLKIKEWEDAMERLEKEPEEGILGRLKVSYDGLKETEKQIFLDIACFFKGKRRDHVTVFLEYFGFHPVIGLQVLIDRCLIIIVDDELWMHDLLQEMGWKIVRDKSLDDPRKRSRLWKEEDIHQVLRRNADMEDVEGIMLNSYAFRGITLTADFFSKMKRLRFLTAGMVKLECDLTHLPNELKLLIWNEFPSESLPPTFDPHELGGLIMNDSSIKYLWNGVRVLNRLKLMDLSYCKELIKTPDLTEVPNLESLLLKGCRRLIEVHESTGALKKLTILDLRGCHYLEHLPSKMEANSMQELFLPQTSNLRTFPEITGKIDKFSFDESHSRLDLRNCENLVSLPSNIFKWRKFTEIELKWCPEFRKFPDIIGRTKWVKKLCLWKTGIEEVPSSIANLAGLVELNIQDCDNLTCLPDSICKLTCLESLMLCGCSKLTNLPTRLGELECLQWLDIRGCKDLVCVPDSVCRLTGLIILQLCGFSESLPKDFRELKDKKIYDIPDTAMYAFDCNFVYPE